jgi:hypothetical protein
MVELSTHDIVQVPGDQIDAVPTLVVPDPHGVVVGGREDPWQLVMEVHSADVVDMAFQHEHAAFLLVVPDAHIATV